jgi:hypothetical protein
MKRVAIILLAGVALALGGYAAVYRVCTASHLDLTKDSSPELAWLKEEFHLPEAEFDRITRLHAAYQDACMERCGRIDSKNRELARLLGSTNAVTPEIEKLLRESAELRAECQKAMLQHFFEVSRTMPADQGKRYLAWVQQHTVLSDTHSSMHH